MLRAEALPVVGGASCPRFENSDLAAGFVAPTSELWSRKADIEFRTIGFCDLDVVLSGFASRHLKC